MEVEIQNDNTKAVIDPHGAWLTNLSNEFGDIIFPKRNLTADDGSIKQRGGSHVCLPNFGSGGSSGQPQHGFGRQMDWELTDKTNSSVLLTLRKGPGAYSEMESVLAYQLGDDRLVMTLEVVNNGTADLRVAPAFHPYFALTEENEVAIDSVEEPLENLKVAQFTQGTMHTLDIAGRTLTLVSSELQTWAKWTDHLGKYVCVEPSLDGFTFLKDTPENSEMIGPGESRTYTFTISWT